MAPPIDYAALAKQAGAIQSDPPKVDYAALAAQAGAVKSELAAKQTQQQPPPEKHGYLYEAVAGPLRALKNVAVGTYDAMQPRDAAEREYYNQTGGYALNPVAPIGNLIAHTFQDIGSGLEAGKAARDKAKAQGEGLAGQTLATAEQYPIIGPLVSKAEKAGPGYANFTPDTLGTVTEGATYAALPELQKRAIPAISNVVNTVKEVPNLDLQGAIRNGIGLGDRMVRRTAEKALADHAEDVAKVQDQNTAATQKYQRNVDRVQQNQDALNQQTNLKNQQAAREWYEQTRTAQDINDLQKEQVGQRAALGQKINQSATKLGGDVRALEEAVRNRGNSLYDVVSEKTQGKTVPADSLAESVRYAENNLLSGSAENIKQFRELVKKGEGQEVQLGGAASGGVGPGHPLYEQLKQAGVIPGADNLSFRDLQGYYTELGQKLASGNLPGDIYRAVKYVRQQIGNQMDGMAKSAGVLDDLNRAKAYWRDYEDTFHNMRPVSQGGSPIARVFRADPQDPGFVAAPLTGKASARAVSMLSKYDPDLAKVAGQIASDTEAAKKLPSTIRPKALPDAPEPAVARTLQKPTPPELQPTPEAPNLPDLVKAARENKVIGMGEPFRKFNVWDLAGAGTGLYRLISSGDPSALAGGVAFTILKHGIGSWLDKPEVVDWLSKTTPRDIEILKQFTPKQQNQIQQAVTSALTKQVRIGGDVNPVWNSFLRPAQVAAIANATPKYKTPADIMDAMKNGELDQVSGNAMLQRIKGKSGVTTRPIQ